MFAGRVFKIMLIFVIINTDSFGVVISKLRSVPFYYVKMRER